MIRDPPSFRPKIRTNFSASEQCDGAAGENGHIRDTPTGFHWSEPYSRHIKGGVVGKVMDPQNVHI